MCFNDEVDYPNADQTYICNLALHQNQGQGLAIENWFKPLPCLSTDHSSVVPLLQFFFVPVLVVSYDICLSLCVTVCPQLSQEGSAS